MGCARGELGDGAGHALAQERLSLLRHRLRRASGDARGTHRRGASHRGTAKFGKINSHMVALPRLEQGAMSCVNCHGPAHPTRAERTPGSALYETLMGGRRHESGSRDDRADHEHRDGVRRHAQRLPDGRHGVRGHAAWLVAMVFYARRVIRDLRARDVL